MGRALYAVAAVAVAALLLGTYIFLTMQHGRTKTSIVLCIAGAYASEGHELADMFSNLTGSQVVVKPGGSFALAHEIALGSPCDVFMPVAFRQAVVGMGAYNPGWAIALAADSNVIVYSNASIKAFPGMADLISLYESAYTTNDSKLWYRFFYELTSGRYPLGVANPATDPEGLYAMLILEAAGELYAGDESFFIARMAQNHANITRSSTFYYVVPLEEGQIAFVFSYKSYAVANKLLYLELPPWLNFGDMSYSSWYSRFSWTIPIGGNATSIEGAPVYLYITIPKDARNLDASLEFLLFALRNRGELAKYGLTPLDRPIVFGDVNSMPMQLRDLLNNGTLQYGGPLT